VHHPIYRLGSITWCHPFHDLGHRITEWTKDMWEWVTMTSWMTHHMPYEDGELTGNCYSGNFFKLRFYMQSHPHPGRTWEVISIISRIKMLSSLHTGLNSSLLILCLTLCCTISNRARHQDSGYCRCTSGGAPNFLQNVIIFPPFTFLSLSGHEIPTWVTSWGDTVIWTLK
jgi:hypothetical protein